MEQHTVRDLSELRALLQSQQPMLERRLGEILQEEHGLDASQLEVALRRQRRRRCHLGRILRDMGAVSGEAIHAALARKFGIPRITLDLLEIDSTVLSRLPPEVAMRYKVMPLGEVNGALVVAMENPLDSAGLDAVRFNSGGTVIPVQASAREILLAHNKYYSRFDEDRALRDTQLPVLQGGQAEEVSSLAMEQQARARPIVRLLDAILLQGILRGASDINLRPGNEGFEIFYRIDGQLRFSRALDKSLQAPLVSRVKIIGDMDIAERRLPQDGNARFLRGGRCVDLRLSVLPTVQGESVVIRILDRERSVKQLDGLGLPEALLARLRKIMDGRRGLFLVTGQTGAGKTTTLYALLHELRKERPHIISVEDPVEYAIEGVEQVQVLEKKGLGFARILRHILRHDPDIIMVGEIRDAETAAIANRAALTGHLVLSTLHTNDAVSAVTRLLDLGVPPYVLSANLLGVMAQRLLRLNCSHCLAPDPLGARLAGRLAPHRMPGGQGFQRGAGCTRCHHTGYRGRTLVAEILPVTSALAEAIGAGARAAEMARLAREAGMCPLARHALALARAGRTSLEEVFRAGLLVRPDGPP